MNSYLILPKTFKTLMSVITIFSLSLIPGLGNAHGHHGHGHHHHRHWHRHHHGHVMYHRGEAYYYHHRFYHKNGYYKYYYFTKDGKVYVVRRHK